jgi:hypothetical protein
MRTDAQEMIIKELFVLNTATPLRKLNIYGLKGKVSMSRIGIVTIFVDTFTQALLYQD